MLPRNSRHPLPLFSSQNRVSFLTCAVEETLFLRPQPTFPWKFVSTVANFRSDGGCSAALARPHAYSAGNAGTLTPFHLTPCPGMSQCGQADTFLFCCNQPILLDGILPLRRAAFTVSSAPTPTGGLFSKTIAPTVEIGKQILTPGIPHCPAWRSLPAGRRVTEPPSAQS